MITNKLLTSDQVGEILGVKQQTLANWRASDQGPRWIKVGSLVRYPLSEVKRFLNRCGLTETEFSSDDEDRSDDLDDFEDLEVDGRDVEWG